MIGYQCLCGQEVPKKELKAEFKTARYLVEVRLGERHLYPAAGQNRQGVSAPHGTTGMCQRGTGIYQEKSSGDKK